MFKQFAAEFYENNLPVIPLKGKGNYELFEWRKFIETFPSSNHYSLWEEDYPEANIGLLCGKNSGLIAIDIDVDDEYVFNLIPQSHIRKIGSKGETRFFKYNPEIQSEKILDPNKNVIFEVLTDGRICVLPPSIHPDTNEPYKWLTRSTILNDEPPSLPSNFNQIRDAIKNHYSKSPMKKSNGRHDTLLAICTAAIFSGKTDEIIIKELLEYDNTNHSNPYFNDQKEKQTPEKFIKSVRKTLKVSNPSTYNVVDITPALTKEKQTQSDKLDQLTLLGEELDSNENDILLPFEPLPIPQTGILNLIYKGVMSYDYNDISPMAVASSHAIISSIFARRFCITRSTTYDVKLKNINIWPHGYYLCLAPSGVGKSYGPKFLSQDIMPYIKGMDKQINICESFGSSHGILYQLNNHPVTLSKHEEASELFNLITQGKRKDISDVLCNVFSNTFDKTQAGVTKETSKLGNVIAQNPALQLLYFTTQSSFEASMNRDINDWGLLPRFKIFSFETYKSSERVILSEAEHISLINSISSVFDNVKPLKYKDISHRNMREKEDSLGLERNDEAIVPNQLELSEEIARDVLAPIELWSQDLMKSLGDDHIASRFLNRCIEHVLITTLDYELSNFDWINEGECFFNLREVDYGSIKVTEEGINYGLQMFKHNLYNLCKCGNGLQNDSFYLKSENKILDSIRKAAEKGIIVGSIGRGGKHIPSHIKQQIVRALLIDQKIVIFKHWKREVAVMTKYAKIFKELHPEYEIMNL